MKGGDPNEHRELPGATAGRRCQCDGCVVKSLSLSSYVSVSLLAFLLPRSTSASRAWVLLIVHVHQDLQTTAIGMSLSDLKENDHTPSNNNMSLDSNSVH